MRSNAANFTPFEYRLGNWEKTVFDVMPDIKSHKTEPTFRLYNLPMTFPDYHDSYLALI